jgi:hypothetical protein
MRNLNGCFLWAGPAAAQRDAAERAVHLEKIAVYVNRMPPGPARVIVFGKILAPSPCYAAAVEHLPDDPIDPDLYRLRILLKPLPADCKETSAVKDFDFRQPDYMKEQRRWQVETDFGKVEGALTSAY